MKRRLLLLGAGVSFPDHLTRETLARLQEVDVIFSNLPEDWLAELPGNLSEKSISVWPLYVDGRRRQENYQRVVSAICEKLNEFSSVAWLTRGNPVVFDSVTFALGQEARNAGWGVEICPAISSIDTLLVDVEFEPAAGMLICEATEMVTRKIALNSSLATMILQPSAFLTPEARLGKNHNAIDLRPLADHLQQYYPIDHPCAFVISAQSSESERRVTWSTIGELSSMDQNLMRGSTMFVPPVASVE